MSEQVQRALEAAQEAGDQNAVRVLQGMLGKQTAAAGGSEPRVPQETAPPPSIPGGSVDLLDVLADELALGGGDEITGALGAALDYVGDVVRGRPTDFSGDFEKRRSAYRSALDSWKEQNPTLGKIGVGTSMLVGGGAIGKGIKAAATIPGKIGRIVGSGGTIGGTSAALQAEGDLMDRAAQVPQGAALGAALGLGLTAGGKALMATVGPAAGAVLNKVRGPERAAARKVLQALERDQITPEQAMARLRRLGDQAMIADVGEGTQSLARGVATAPGPAQGQAERALERRMRGQGGRIMEGARRQMGVEGDLYGTIDDLVTARSSAAQAAYRKAYDEAPAVIASTELGELMQRPSMQAAAENARRIAQDEGVTPPRTSKLDLRSWDLVKRGLDVEIEKYRDKTTGKLVLDELGRAKLALKNRLVDLVDEQAGPAYKAARAQFSGYSDSIDAAQRGRTFLRGDEEITQRAIEGLSEGDKVFFREGVVREIRRIIENRPDGADVVRALFGNEAKRKKLQAVFPSKRSFDRFRALMLAEARMAQTRNKITQGSRTQVLAAEQADAGIDPSMVADAARGNVGGLATNLIRRGAEYMRRPTPAQRAELGDMLFMQDPVANQQLLQGLMRSAPIAPSNLPQGLLGPLIFGVTSE